MSWMMINRPYFAAGVFCICAGCSSFTHQASSDEPHALLLIQSVSEGSRSVKSIDGRRVSLSHTGKTYRIQTGSHSVTLYERGTVNIEYTNKAEDQLAQAMMSLVGESPMPSSYQEVSEMEFTEFFSTQAGGHYILTPYVWGEPVSEQSD